MNKAILFSTVLFFTITFSACNESAEKTVIKDPSKEVINSSQVNSNNIRPTIKETYSLSEINKHNNAKDCWLVVDKKVYDITPYVVAGLHPNGATILKGCGVDDATDLFNIDSDHPGNLHSNKARRMLESYFIGEVK